MSEHHHRNWQQAFDQERTEAEGRRQQAVTEAHRACAEAKSALRRKHASEPRELDGDAQYHRHVRELKSLDDALDADVRKADAAYHAEVRQAAQRNKVTVQ